MQCLTWAFSKPHGSQQQPFSFPALWSRSEPRRLPPPHPAPLGAAGGALAEHLSLLCRGLLRARSITRAETVVRVGRQVDITSRPKSSTAALPSSPHLLSCISAGLPCDISLALGAIKSSVAPRVLRCSPCTVAARTEPAHATPRARVRARRGSSIGSPWQDPRFNRLSEVR